LTRVYEAVLLTKRGGRSRTLKSMNKTVIQHVLSRLSDIGVKDVFGPGTSTEDIVKYVQQNVKV